MPDSPLAPAAVAQVRSWVRDALVLETGGEPAPAAPAVASDAALVEAVRRHRVAEVLAPHTSRLGVPAPVADAIGHFRQAGRRAVTVQVLEIGRAHAHLAGAGVDALAIKGPALAVQSAGDAAARGPGDVDLLVGPEQVEHAHRTLVAHGWALRATSLVTPGSWAWKHTLRSFHTLTYDGPGSSIDLHWRLDATFGALPGFTELWARRVEADLGHGVRVPTLAVRDALAHSCLHAAKDHWRWLRSLVDVHRLARLPSAWDRDWPEEPLRRLEAATLAVTRAQLGLPAGVPPGVLVRLDSVPAAVLARAGTAQERPVHLERRYPGEETARQLRYLVAASPAPRDLVHAAAVVTLPVSAVVGVEARSAWTGVPLALGQRLRGVGRRLRTRRRSRED